MSQCNWPTVAANEVRRYKISVTMVCSMNKNNIRNGQEKSIRRIVRFKSKICEIKNISSETQIIPFTQYVAKFVQKHACLAVIGRNMGGLLLFNCSILIKITDMWNKNMYMC